MPACTSHQFSVPILLACFIGSAITRSALAQPATSQPASRPHTLTGEFKYHTGIHSQFVRRDRDIIVYLPPGYDMHPQQRYPVFYMHDGNNLFDRATGFAGNEWNMDETAQTLIEKGQIEPIIIVGIYNTGDRMSEYSPFAQVLSRGTTAPSATAPSARGRGATGRGGTGATGDDYGRFIVEELKPMIDSTYRTLPDPANTAVGGSSMGGLISMYFGIKYPNVFGKIAVVSPSVQINDNQIIRTVSDLPAKTNVRVWLDMGTNEGGNGAAALGRTRGLRDALIAKGWKLDEDLNYFEAEGEAHNEGAWSRRADRILLYLFPKK
jgi:predicted alpha/beta superfamily hydrolase